MENMEDSQLPEDLFSLTCVQLRALLKVRGLKNYGLKRELVARLTEYLLKDTSEEGDENDNNDKPIIIEDEEKSSSEKIQEITKENIEETIIVAHTAGISPQAQDVPKSPRFETPVNNTHEFEEDE